MKSGLLAFLLLSTPALGQVDWDTVVHTYVAESNLRNMAVGDINGDLYPDIAFVQDDPGGVFVCLNLGNGEFGPAKKVGTTPGAGAVALGHLDGDGLVDMVTTTGSVVTIFRGRGQGNFKAGVPSPVAGIQSASVKLDIQMGDLNGDGFDELITSDAINGFLMVGNCQGRVQNPVWISAPLGAGAARIQLGDLNQDGHLDVVASGNSYGWDNGTIFLGGSGFALTPIGSIPSSFGGGSSWVELGDFDGDGILDVLSFESDCCAIDPVIWKGTGTGTFLGGKLFESYATNWDPAAAGDLNGDGKLDFAALGNTDSINTFMGLGEPGWLRKKSVPYSNAKALVMADFDLDGIDDLAVLGSAPGFLRIELSRPHKVSSFSNEWKTGPGWQKTHHMGLKLDPSFAGFPYLVLGTQSGTSPGTSVGALHLPLNLDPYTYFSFENPNTWVSNSWGTINSHGSAFATLEMGIQKLPPILKGTFVHHSFVVLDPVTYGVVWISDAVELALLPPVQ